jgi:hypothetical protein
MHRNSVIGGEQTLQYVDRRPGITASAVQISSSGGNAAAAGSAHD